jgi:hypothetical protein
MSSDTDDCGNACVAAWEANEAHQSHSAVHPYFHRGFVAGRHAAAEARADSAVPSSHVSDQPSALFDRGSGKGVQAPEGTTERAEEDQRVRRLIQAIEGECEGLVITEQHAKAILEYVDGETERD